jgi:hypothetical protein
MCAICGKTCTRKEKDAMKNTAKLLAIGLVLGGGSGIASGSATGNIPMGIVFGGGFGMILGLGIGALLDRRARSQG